MIPILGVTPRYPPAKTLMLLHCDGSNGGTTFADASTYAATPTVTACTTSTSETKFGTASLLGGGSGAQLAYGSLSQLQLGTADFTIEMWYYPSGGSITENLFASDITTSAGWMTLQNLSGTLRFQCATGNPLFTASSSVPTGQFSHIALVRASGVFTLYQNGVSVANATPSALNVTMPDFLIPASSGSLAFSGFGSNLDEIRVSRIARYLGNFTPPTSPFTPD